MDQLIKDFSLDYFNLKGKVAIVTGGNTNLGMCYAIAFAKAGADLFIPHFDDDIDELKEAAEEAGVRIEFYKGDLTDKAYRDTVVPKCIELFGRLDILVNNAGISKGAPLEEMPEEWYQAEIELDLNVCWYMCRNAGLAMRKLGNGGKIINIGSALSFTGSASGSAYTIAKHGVIGLTKNMAAIFMQDNIQVNAICPGFFDSPVNRGVPQKARDEIARRLPGNVWGSPGELMGTAVFLASEASHHVSGVAISVDGGFAANYF